MAFAEKENIDKKIQQIVSFYLLKEEYKDKSKYLLNKIAQKGFSYKSTKDKSLLDECKELEKEHKELFNKYKGKLENCKIRLIGKFRLVI